MEAVMDDEKATLKATMAPAEPAPASHEARPMPPSPDSKPAETEADVKMTPKPSIRDGDMRGFPPPKKDRYGDYRIDPWTGLRMEPRKRR